jgi:hypothetical protein
MDILEVVITDLKTIIDETSKKNDALEDQVIALENLRDNGSLMKSLQLTSNFTSKLAELHVQTKKKSENYLHCLKKYFLFYFEVAE